MKDERKTKAQLIEELVELRQMKQALQAREAKFRELSNASFEGMAITRGGKLIDFNDRLVQMHGYEENEMRGLKILDLIAPESRDFVDEQIRLENDGPYEYSALRKDGSKFDAEVYGKNIEYDGSPSRVSAVRDISNRVKWEKAILAANNRWATIGNTMPIGVLVATPKGHLSYANDLAGNILRIDTAGGEILELLTPKWRVFDLDGNPLPENDLILSKILSNYQAMKIK